MPTTPHGIVKAEKLVNLAMGLLHQELVIPQLFTKVGIDNYKYSFDDTINYRVPGILPSREYTWRNDRSEPIQFDTLTEKKVNLTFGRNVYSAVQITDEQHEMDLDTFSDLFGRQAWAVGRGLERGAVDALENAPYEVTIRGAEAGLRSALIEARKVLNRFNVPDEQRILLVGSDFEAALLDDSKIVLAHNSGDSTAESALRSAVLGNLLGFRVVTSVEIDSASAYAVVPSGFTFLSAAPYVPTSAPFGATTSYNGIALRWIRDYDTEYQQDRSVVNTWAGFDYVKDFLVGLKGDGTTNEQVTEDWHFVRGVKLTIGDTPVAADYPAVGSDFAEATGVSRANPWTPPSTTEPVDPEV